MQRYKVLLLVSLCLFVAFGAVPTLPVHGNAEAVQVLPAGSWWTLDGETRWIITGSGSYAGIWTIDETYSYRFTVLGSNVTTASISFYTSAALTTTATGSWVRINGGESQKRTGSNTVDWVINRTSSKVKAVSDMSFNDWIDHVPYFLTTPPTSPGATVTTSWVAPNSDQKSAKLTEIPMATNPTNPIQLGGLAISAFNITHSGPALGFWNDGTVFSKGIRTETRSFDSIYGIALGWVITGNFALTKSGGSWTEVLSNRAAATGTSLTFTVPVIFSTDPADAAVTVDGVAYSGRELPKILTWQIYSVHALQVNNSIQLAPGVRYVFVEWNDGSTQTSRTINVTQSGTFTARFKLQYELKVNSDYGSPQGAGWYDASSTATFSVSSPQPDSGLLGMLGGSASFHGWTGGTTATDPTATIKMDGPKNIRAEWTTNDLQPYVILAVAALLIMGALSFAVIRLGLLPAVPGTGTKRM